MHTGDRQTTAFVQRFAAMDAPWHFGIDDLNTGKIANLLAARRPASTGLRYWVLASISESVTRR